ncbi:MAG: hypothetical protein IKS70_02895, partial [Bacteroides sp.]|nr:hypothetical protein [Bacteroides sp.]
RQAQVSDNQWTHTLRHKPPGEVIDLLLIPNSGIIEIRNGLSDLPNAQKGIIGILYKPICR